MITFKEGVDKRQWFIIHYKLRTIAFFLDKIFEQLGYGCEITSMVRPKDAIIGESNVHSTGRAMDVVARVLPKSPIRPPGDYHQIMVIIANLINYCYPRTDQKLTCIYHSVTGWHFHVQIQYDLKYVDLDGTCPESRLEPFPIDKPLTETSSDS